MAPYVAADVKSTLPSSWYREKPLYELERRAVFGKSWLLITHELQFEKPGHYVRYEVAGYPFFIIKDRKGNINAFLNVCRHRAYPLVHKDEGTASILACQYHGWSYGLGGNLAKAPRFDQVEDFNTSEYSLFKLHLRIDERGFIWVNLDGADTPTISWDEQFQGVDTQPRLKNFDMKDYAYDHTWVQEGCNFNWKTLVENYNECYHCPTAHPGLAQYIKNNTKLEYGCHKNYVLHLGGGDEEHAAVVSPTYMFPHASTTMTPNFFYMMQILPTSATTSIMRYEFYKSSKCSVQDFQADMDFYKQVEGEDKILANNTQANLNTNTYIVGPLHPNVEEAVAYFETLIRKVLKDHAQEEKQKGKELWPARRGLGSKQEDEDEAFCRGVCDSATGENGALAW